MLEAKAIEYFTLPEETTKFYGILVFIAGFVVAALVARAKKRSFEINRAPFFFYMSLIYFLASVSKMAWLGMDSALRGGYLWTLIAFNAACIFASGYFTSVLAMARSRSAFGNSKGAILAFFPIINFWLLFAPPKSQNANTLPSPAYSRGALGVICAFVLMFCSVVLIGLTEKFSDKVYSNEQVSELLLEKAINSEGIEKVLQHVAVEARKTTPRKVEDGITLETIEAFGSELRRTFRTDYPTVIMTEELRQMIINDTCEKESLFNLMKSGAIIRDVFLSKDGSAKVNVTVTQELCPEK
jgi:hypothetical protein